MSRLRWAHADAASTRRGMAAAAADAMRAHAYSRAGVHGTMHKYFKYLRRSDILVAVATMPAAHDATTPAPAGRAVARPTRRVPISIQYYCWPRAYAPHGRPFGMP